jgi:hypothetical protein
MDTKLKNQLMSFLLASYKDYDNPDFGFVMKNFDSNKYCKIREQLNEYIVIDNTDLNYDTCESFKIKLDNEIVYLYISLVGPYFYMLNKDDVVVDGNIVNDMEAKFIDEIEQLGLSILNRKQLLYCLPVSIKCADEEKYSSVLKLFFAPELYI